MGFLDGLVSDMIGESVGFNPRRLIRMVGGKNLLMLGAGAALAGGLASAGQAGQAGSSPSQMTGRPSQDGPDGPPPVPPPPAPPPPPPPSSQHAAPPPPPGAVPPPPPGAPEPTPAGSADDDTVELPPGATYAIVRAMAAAALADGSIDPQEKQVIQARLGESNLTAEQTRQIHHDLVLPPSPDELAALAPPGEGREVLYRFAALVVLVDQEVSDLERGWLDRLARAFELDAGRVAELEKEIFAT